MKQEDKETLKKLLIYLDLLANSKDNLVNTEGLMAVFQLQDEYPEFANVRKRHALISKLLEEIDK